MRFCGLLLVVLCACGGGSALDLAIIAPCNAESLGASGVAFVELRVESPDLQAPFTATFGANDAKGSLDDVSRVANAVIEVAGRSSSSNGSPGVALVGGGVGLVDLSAETDALAMVAGPVDSFVRTTATSDGTCSEQAQARALHSASLLRDGRVLVAGGVGDSGVLGSTEIYVPTAGAFVPGPALGEARSAHTGTRLKDGNVLLAGGVGANARVLSTFEIFDGQSFTTSRRLSHARANHSATLLADGRVLLAGGDDGAGVLGTTDIYDPATGTVTQGPTLEVARARHSAVRIDESIVALLGGIGDDDVIADIEFVDVDAGRSTLGPQLRTARSDAAAAWVDARGAIVIAGGFTNRALELARGVATNSIEVIDVSGGPTNAAIACSDARLLEGRGAAIFADIPNGLLVAGGVSSPGQVSTTAETLDFTAGPCRPTIDPTDSDLFASRFAAAHAVLASGDILVTGGMGVRDGTTVSRNAGELFIIER